MKIFAEKENFIRESKKFQFNINVHESHGSHVVNVACQWLWLSSIVLWMCIPLFPVPIFLLFHFFFEIFLKTKSAFLWHTQNVYLVTSYQRETVKEFNCENCPSVSTIKDLKLMHFLSYLFIVFKGMHTSARISYLTPKNIFSTCSQSSYRHTALTLHSVTAHCFKCDKILFQLIAFYTKTNIFRHI